MIGPDRSVRLVVGGGGAVPAEATVVVLNVAATNVSTPSLVSICKAGQPATGASNLNLAPGQTIANFVICRLGAQGAVEITNPQGNCDVLADLFGYFVD